MSKVLLSKKYPISVHLYFGGVPLRVERLKYCFQVRSYCTFGVRRGAIFLLLGFTFVSVN